MKNQKKMLSVKKISEITKIMGIKIGSYEKNTE